eukprot:CAMPEP_0206477700 /NCGR_PEP_ID=MMETSP0324_2-20121206/35575_1 /ASSEMBLY_ACC=CAM_ASM_000836 /TAXON_ID=2866 /ORGANISM="Crypthecodinium cohnii, Strain Seligo" /LENGTH=144 /DNA_ID=CAMNT_0053953787 /DNA_START=67 /DNA_END=501 /DNA_ORIENTATION=+
MTTICTISANSSDGFSSPAYSTNLPPDLAASGIDSGKWKKLIEEANEAVKFRWCPQCAIWAGCCFLPFFCNQHNKNIRPYMEELCDRWNKGELPAGLHVKYEMVTEAQSVKASNGSAAGKGSTLETYHKIHFCSGAPEQQTMGK